MSATVPTSVAGPLLRPARWPDEAAVLVDLNNGSRRAGGSLFLVTVETLHATYDNLVNCDLASDLRIADIAGRPVGYVRVDWRDERRGDRVHGIAAFHLPDAPAGTFAALLDWAIARHLEIASGRPTDRRRLLAITVRLETPDVRPALEARGFAAVRYGFDMLRPTLEDIPELGLPAGIEVRPVQPADLRRIWEAEGEAFEGHWGASDLDRGEEAWRAFLADPFTDHGLWQVAWAGDEVVGMVRPFINDEENAISGVSRGWCENISTRAPWRGRGVASALIVRALRALRARGMTEAALGVDAQNETGALGLYRRMGFREASRETEWRRPLGPGTDR